MPIVPVRSLAERGLILDAPAFDLPPNAFSNGSNVRFRDGAARRSSVLRTARDAAVSNARAAWGYSLSSGYDRLFIGSIDGSIVEVNEDNTTDDRSPAVFTPAADPRPWTWCQLGDVSYANKPSHAPVYFPGGAATTFEPLPGWPATQRARAIGVARDQLFAVNLVDGLTTQPNTVAISDYALYAAPPATWDPVAVGSMANAITLAGARSPLVGCLDLDGTMIVYGERQCWRFVFTGDTSNQAQNLWINEPLSNDRGLIAPNAVAYHQRRHYVFGVDDLWTHDGVSTASLADERVRRWLFRNIDVGKAERCFAVVDPNVDEVLFAFPSKDGDAVYPVGVGCNRAVVLNLRSGNFSLIDLNDVTSGDFSNFNPTTLWQTAATPWLTFGGSWSDLSDGYGRNAMLLGPRDGDTTARILAIDEAYAGRVSFDAPDDENPTAFVERVGFDLDEAGAPLSGYKIISTIFPQLAVRASLVPIRIRVGASITPQGPYTWGEWRDFYPTTDYRVDFNKGGRYLGIRMEMNRPVDFEFSGFDADIRPGGRR